MRLFLSVLLLSCLVGPGLRAQVIVAPGARTLFNRSAMIRWFLQVDHSSLGTEASSVEDTRYLMPLAVVYGVYPNWSLILVQPYVSFDRNIHMENSTQGVNRNGLADAQWLVQYDGLYLRNTPGGFTRLSGVFGLRLPTGAGKFSSGAVEYTAGLILEKATRLTTVFTTDFEYTFATENGQGVSRGDHARFDFASAYFLIPRNGTSSPAAGWLRKAYERVFRNGAYLVLEINGSWRARARKRGVSLEDTGGTIVSISPGIQYFPSRRLLFEFSSPIPVVKALKGRQSEPDSTLIFGLRYLF